MSNIQLYGIRENQIIKKDVSDNIEKVKYLCDGLRLTELHLVVTLTTHNDIIELIDLLKIHSLCLKTNPPVF